MFELKNETEVEYNDDTAEQFRALSELQLVLVGGGTGDATLC